MHNQDSPILCSDVIFKSVFLHHEEILIKMIYDITGLRLENIHFYMNEIPIRRGNEKFKRCDFIIHTDKNIIINIELNRDYSKTILIKNTSYLYELFSTYVSRGEDYNENLKVIQININHFSRFGKSVLSYKMMNYTYQYVYLDNIKIWDLDIIKTRELYYKGLKRVKRYIKWGALFGCTSLEEMEPILEELLTKREAYVFMNKLKKITRTITVMDEEEALREDEKIRRSLRREGEKIGFSNGEKVGFSNGFTDGIMSMVKSMIDHNIDIDTISKVSNKSVDEIEKIIKV